MTGKTIPSVAKKGLFRIYNSFTKDPLQFLRSYATNETGISTFQIFHYRMVHLTHPDLVKHILADSPEKYTQSRDRDHMKLLFGNGLLTTTGKHWQKQRAMIQPCFGRPQLEKLFKKIVEQDKAFPPQQGENVDIHQYSLDLVNRIIADIIFSSTSENTLDIGNALIELKGETLKRLSDFALPLWLPTPRNLRYKKDRDQVYKKIGVLIEQRKTSGEKKDDLLSFFMGSKDKTTQEGMTHMELVEELLGVYAAAHEPVAIALTYAVFLVAKNKGVKEKLDKELQTVLNHPEFTLEKFGALNYTKNVIQETLRLYPPVWVSGKRALEDDTINGYAIKKNDNFMYSPVILHSLPEFWEEPERFNPDRFLEKPKHPFVYLPFSGGAKFCVGSHLALMILQTALADLQRSYSIETKIEEVNINPFTTLKPENTILVSVVKKI